MILRGSKTTGYRSATPLECPHCCKPIAVSGRVDSDKQGPHLVLWPVAPRPGEYTLAEVRYVVEGPPSDALTTGVALPKAPRRTEFRDDPVPTFGPDERR